MSLLRPDQGTTPYITSITHYLRQERLPFHMPGHKQGKGIQPHLRKLWGSGVFRYDLTEVDGQDYLNAPTGVIREAERLAALAFGAKRTYFLVNGSTLGNQAAILSLVQDGGKIIMPRNSHLSVYAALVLSGARPVYVRTNYDESLGIHALPAVSDIRKALDANPDAKAVHITSPDYNGFVPDLKSIIRAAHARHIPVIVDEAHGAHFPFHPRLPASAIRLGADIVVQSTHKTLGSLTQTSMLHLARTAYVTPERLQQTLILLQSSSPNTLFIMSLDAARQHMAIHGRRLLQRTIGLADSARRLINAIPNFHCYGNDAIGQANISDFDRTKLFIDVSRTGLTGFETERILGRKYRIEIEMSDDRHILCFVTIGDDRKSVGALVNALRDISYHHTETKPFSEVTPLPNIPKRIMSPRRAFFARRRPVHLDDAVGKTCGEFILPLPPDIPIIVPGEQITPQLLRYVKHARESGIMLVGSRDSSLKTIEIIS